MTTISELKKCLDSEGCRFGQQNRLACIKMDRLDVYGCELGRNHTRDIAELRDECVEVKTNTAALLTQWGEQMRDIKAQYRQLFWLIIGSGITIITSVLIMLVTDRLVK